MKKLLSVCFLFFVLGWYAAQAQSVDSLSKIQTDSLLIGRWKLQDPAQAKMLKSMGEMFMRGEIHFADRGVYTVPKEFHNWQWSYKSASKSLVISDLDYEEFQTYPMYFKDVNSLVIQLKTQDLIFIRTKE